MLGEYITDLLQPWRRVSRVEFGVAIGLASLPGVLMLLGGLGSGSSGLLGPLASMGGLSQAMSSQTDANVAALNQFGNQLSAATNPLLNPQAAAAAAAATAHGLNLSGLVNPIALLLATPYCRGRLNDMGYSPRLSLILTALIQLSMLNDIVAVFYGPGILPMGTLFMLLNFGGYAWLTMGKTQARPRVSERLAPRIGHPPDDDPHTPPPPDGSNPFA